MDKNEKIYRLHDWITNMDECGLDSLIEEYLGLDGTVFKKVSPPTFSEDEVRTLIQNIYSEFTGLVGSYHTFLELRKIIGREVEGHPRNPIKIFKD